MLLMSEPTLGDLGRAEGIGHEAGGIGVPVNDVDLLLVELVHDSPHPLSHRSDTGALSVDVGMVGVHRDLGPVAGLPDDFLDLPSITASATCRVSCSWTWGRLAKTSTTRASLEMPQTRPSSPGR